MSTRRAPVSLHIERLVLEGLPLGAGQQARMQASLQRELRHLLAGRHAVGAAAERAQGPLVWDAARPVALGRALAHQVYASLAAPRGRS